MMFMKAASTALVLFSAAVVSGFNVQPTNPRLIATSLRMSESERNIKTMATSVVAAGFLIANVGVAPAIAMDAFDVGTSQVIAGRSGGRAGGRSSMPRSYSRPPPSRSTTVINRTYVTPSPMYSPGVIVAPPVYNPLPGIGLGIGLNAVNQIGNDMRDYRQETEIQRTRAELEASKIREAQMEARLAGLEAGQQAQNIAVQQQMATQAAAQAAAAR